MAEIKVIFEGFGRRTEKSFLTIAQAVEHLSRNGYTRASGAGFYDVGYSTRRYKDTRSGRYARINTTSDCGCWLPIVEQTALNLFPAGGTSKGDSHER